MPFWSDLRAKGGEQVAYPIFLSIPFLDWGVNGEPPPLRFQVDKREGYSSSRSSSHLLRSILEYFYRLEDTADRERNQVFNKHKPWKTDRELDLKVRRWYGRHPRSLNVDELWILIIDPTHIVTFSSNQSWKSRWPPLQLASRISNISFRGLRNDMFIADQQQVYTALTHSIVCLSGAVGMLHRSFWTDIALCMTDRYAGYLGHLQYRIYRAPSTKLVMDLMQVQDELNIVVRIHEQQLALIKSYNIFLHEVTTLPLNHKYSHWKGSELDPSLSHITESATHLTKLLQAELTDLQALLDNSTTLVNRTVQLVNIRLEDHGNAILVFTVVTIVFLPLNFVCSFFGMNVSDIRSMTQTQSLFWIVAACVTTGVVFASVFVAFNGGTMMERFVSWKEGRRHVRPRTTTAPAASSTSQPSQSFHVLDGDGGKGKSW